MDKETNYYPFGMEYEGFQGTNTQLPTYRYGFQGQEKQTETGWSSFKWRNSIPELGRFFNVDPLSEKYAYQSHYNFSENRVVDGRELEGLEWVSALIRAVPLLENSSVKPSPIVETVTKTTETTGKVTNEHHLIPRQHKNHEIVRQAREEGYKFEGKENKLTVEKFNKTTGEGRHANHPKLNEQVKQLLDKIPKSEALNGVRNLRDKAKDAINNNPDTKLNDLKLKTAPPVETDNLRVTPAPAPKIMPVPKPKDPCNGIPGCA
ncbi:RHS repeat domain-containing protein [Chryseobacterium herbae]|uniref:RHS repeat-associated core domain-containing protein n=1 Tax=Chryseobacterium herbae TaxID=2976476 RepID=A0ABT2ISL2_9FLAO|nr:hypothetical protein [Chryseobacterium sp. pc1-10]